MFGVTTILKLKRFALLLNHSCKAKRPEPFNVAGV